MCPNKDLPKREKGFMTLDLFRGIIDQAKDFAFDINLAHRGESLLHPRIVEAVRIAKQSGLLTRLHTNGSLLTRDLSKGLIEAGLDHISFSFDGLTRETYQRIRKGGDFDRTLSRILEFLEVKRELGSRRPVTAVEVINFENVAGFELNRSREAFRRRFKSLPLDSFVVKQMHNWAGEIEAARESRSYTACPFPWNAMVISWDGTVTPCTQDFFNRMPVGNAGDTSLEEIWNGEKMTDLRRRLADGDLERLPVCRECDRLWRKSFLGVPTEFLWKFLFKRMN
jgi:radical SAM protein with 4Fe4S-binding SPASM domain